MRDYALRTFAGINHLHNKETRISIRFFKYYFEIELQSQTENAIPELVLDDNQFLDACG